MPEPVPAVPAATILLVRDTAQGLEVFLIERHPKSDFATGALVFPGGKVDAADADARVAPRCCGIDGLDEAAIQLRVAAIRETFEECGVMLARARGESSLLDAERLSHIEQRYRVEQASIAIGDLVEREDLELACDVLVPFAHWITPTFMPKRFDTHFFLVSAPADQVALHDGVESVDSVWMTPMEAAEAAKAGQRSIIFPTLMNLKKLGRSPNVRAALENAGRAKIVTVMPHLERNESGERIVRIPAEADYDVVAAPVDVLR